MKNDLISRTALINALLNRERSEYEVKNHVLPAEDVVAMIQNAPAVEPTKGKWLPEGVPDWTGYQCNRCGDHALEIDGVEIRSKFCPNCGAEMETDQEAET